MEASELMIGDWLYSIIHNHPDKIVKVTGIRTDCDTVVIQCNDTDVWYPLDTYKPIPLTKEILEKNGYIKDGYFYKKGEYDRIQLGLLFEHASVVCYKDMRFCEVNTSPYLLQYVHQLQHAFRLCGINKEIQV